MRTKRLINRTVIDIYALIVYTGMINYSIYQQFFGTWFQTHPRRFNYIATVLFLLFLLIDELCLYNNKSHHQANILGRCTVMANFALWAAMLYGYFDKPNYYFYLYLLDGFIFVITIMILISATRHGIFKDE